MQFHNRFCNKITDFARERELPRDGNQICSHNIKVSYVYGR